MKRLVSLCLIAFFTVCLCSCSQTSIGKRAIVKAIHIGFNNQYEVSIVVYNFMPTSQIADVKDNAVVYTSQGDTLATALKNAEQKQTKQPFYAQNELLFIEASAVDKLSEITEFFSAENSGRQGVAVYLTDKTADDLKKTEKFLPQIISRCESLRQNSVYIGCKIFGIDKKGTGCNAILPLLEFGEKENDFYGVKTLSSIKNNKVGFNISGEDILFTQILKGKCGSLSLTDIGKDKISLKADGIYLSFEVNKSGKLPRLTVYLRGNIRSLYSNGINVTDKAAAKNSEKVINKFVNESCNKLLAQFYNEEIDAFSYARRFDMYKSGLGAEMLKNSEMFSGKYTQVISELKVI